ncbi:MAG TPA: ABC transporter permease [Ktedonobacterales bacterium]|nr:ABC transporter permease [Ktedonobacterales bacterium]
MTTATAGAIAARPVTHAGRPSFLGLMRGEWLKVSRQWTFWIMVGLMFGGYTLFTIILSKGANLQEFIDHHPLAALAMLTQSPLFLLRVFWGMMIIILTARLIGMEYSGGTARVILARGVGRLQLLFAQLSMMALIALIGGAVFLAFAGALELLGVRTVAGNLDVFKAADATFWADTRNYALSVLISLGVSILLAAAVTSVTRSLAAGLTVSVIWFPIDNFAFILLILGDRLTGWDFWSLVSGDFLGLNLNAMSNLVMSSHTPPAIGGLFQPLTPVTGAHTLLVTAIYAVAFLAVAIGVTATRDVKE